MQQEPAFQNMDALGLLRWYLAAGVDELAGAAPVNRFAEKAAEPAPTAAAPAGARAAPPPARLKSAENIKEEAEAIAQSCTSLAELEAAVRAFDGCALKHTATHTVFAAGNADSPLMLIGDAPGGEEDRQGKPFVGDAGQLLDKMLAAIGLGRDEVYMANILFWRPPGNQKPSPQQSMACLPFVKRHIALARPKLLVFLGGISAGLLLDTTQGITRLRGKWTSYSGGAGDHEAIPAIATYHPANLLQQPHFKADAWRDLLEIRSRLETLK